MLDNAAQEAKAGAASPAIEATRHGYEYLLTILASLGGLYFGYGSSAVP